VRSALRRCGRFRETIERSQAERGLVHEQNAGPDIKRARDRQHSAFWGGGCGFFFFDARRPKALRQSCSRRSRKRGNAAVHASETGRKFFRHFSLVAAQLGNGSRFSRKLMRGTTSRSSGTSATPAQRRAPAATDELDTLQRDGARLGLRIPRSTSSVLSCGRVRASRVCGRARSGAKTPRSAFESCRRRYQVGYLEMFCLTHRRSAALRPRAPADRWKSAGVPSAISARNLSTADAIG